MKIAIIRSEVSYSKGGAERYAANLCRELCDLGHEVWVLAEILGSDVHPAINHVPIQVSHISSSQRNRSFHRNAQAAVAHLKPDQTIALSRTYPSDAFRVSDPLHCFWMGIRYPGKIRRFLEGLNPRHRTILQMERAILDPANTRTIVTNSKLSKKLIAEFYPNYPQDRIHVIYNGVDHTQFSADTTLRDRQTLQLLFVGQDFKRKGLGAVIAGLAGALKKGCDCRLRVIGRDDAAPYREQAKRLGVSSRIDFSGPTKAIQDAYREADLFVFPSLYDPFANVVLESLACGTPVITTSTNGSAEIIEEGRNGYVISGESGPAPEDIAQCIACFCQLDHSERQRMRHLSYDASQRYSILANAQQMIDSCSESNPL
jgi:UDP-glucose:(heptosyl)LPS alpha-1,3-glucosyltransferase